MIRRAQVFVLAVLLLSATAVFADTRYVSDELRINVRSGAGNQYRIIRVIETGMRLEALEEAGEWTRVRVGDDTGWVRSQYLTAQPVAAARLQQAQRQLSDARERISELESSLQEARQALEAERARTEELTGSNEELQQQVASAERGLTLSQENERLREQSTSHQSRIRDLESEVAYLSNQNEREWFMVGAGVLFAGLLSGMVVTRIPWRRRNRMFE